MSSNLIGQRYLSLEQTAAYTGFSRKTLYKWAEGGKIPSYKIGSQWRFDKEEIDAFMHKGNSQIFVNSPSSVVGHCGEVYDRI